jgi:hypothetical protein
VGGGGGQGRALISLSGWLCRAVWNQTPPRCGGSSSQCVWWVFKSVCVVGLQVKVCGACGGGPTLTAALAAMSASTLPISASRSLHAHTGGLSVSGADSRNRRSASARVCSDWCDCHTCTLPAPQQQCPRGPGPVAPAPIFVNKTTDSRALLHERAPALLIDRPTQVQGPLGLGPRLDKVEQFETGYNRDTHSRRPVSKRVDVKDD